jgi:hypothetical protein
MSDQQQVLTPRQRAEQLARAARYGAVDPAIDAIEAAIKEAEASGCAAVMDLWIRRVGERINVDDLKENVDAA